MANLARATTNVPVGWNDLWSRRVARAAAVLREAGVLVALVLLAGFLRTYRLELQAWIPDTYEQLAASVRLVHGEFPLSLFYPPGVALTTAPALLFFPATLATMQAVIIGASLILVAVCYAGTKRATGDRVAATLLAAGVATAPAFVFFSRDGLFDVIDTMWIMSAVMLVPVMRGRSLGAFVAYGVLLSIAINVRATNAAFLPALLIWWSGIGRPGVRMRDALRVSLCRETIIAGGVMAALSVVYAYAGGWFGHAASATPLTLSSYVAHIVLYVVVEFGYLPGVPLIAPLAVLGGFELWRRDRALLFAAVYVMAVWPLVHAPLPFGNIRYMLPPFAFTLLLAAHAPAGVARMVAASGSRGRLAARCGVVAMLSLVALYFAASDAAVLARWPDTAVHSDEASMRELRPVVAGLPDGSLLISCATRGVRASNPGISYFDLIDYSLPRGNGPASVDAVLTDIEHEQAEGRRVYYLHSRMEAQGGTFAKSGPGYESYFDGIERRFAVSPVYVASAPTLVPGDHYTLYEVLPQSQGATPARAHGG